MKRFLIAALAVVPVTLAVVAVAESRVAAPAAPSKVTICHKTGSASNPWRRITISSRAATNPSSSAGRVVGAHLRHTGDVVVMGSSACPSASLTPQASSTPAAKITICHKTGSSTNPYRRITVSSRAWTNPSSTSGRTLKGHVRHAGDMLIAGASACPAGKTGQGSKLTANLQPVSGATGSGSATFTIRLGRAQLCYTLSVTGLNNVTAAHIHRGSTGAVVVPLSAPTTGTSSGCVSVDKTLLQEILNNPGAFYVNVHTTQFQNGQVRGDLTK